jgi:hypothetical protein
MPLRFGYKRSDYDIVCVESDRVFIIDLDLGNKSVTNDAEYVYSELQSSWPNRRVIYRDSIGEWSEITGHCNSLDICFIGFRPYTEHLPDLK